MARKIVLRKEMLGHVKNFSQIGWQTLKMEIKENYQIVPEHILLKLKCKR